MEVSGQHILTPTPYKTYQSEFIQWLQRLGYAMTVIFPKNSYNYKCSF